MRWMPMNHSFMNGFPGLAVIWIRFRRIKMIGRNGLLPTEPPGLPLKYDFHSKSGMASAQLRYSMQKLLKYVSTERNPRMKR